MINKRFKRYKALEDRVRELESALRERDEASARFEAELESERERIERETEQRVINSFLANRHRPHENATATKVGSVTTDVSKLTRGERAALAQRALKGEKIAF